MFSDVCYGLGASIGRRACRSRNSSCPRRYPRCALAYADLVNYDSWRGRFEGQRWVACCMLMHVAGKHPHVENGRFNRRLAQRVDADSRVTARDRLINRSFGPSQASRPRIECHHFDMYTPALGPPVFIRPHEARPCRGAMCEMLQFEIRHAL
ncbi:hypothetical protein EVAR_54780_1 [Eumeta japonica]|uniref:Uncharacterized protein n=1 Tax=Eumeta variegata TaxID=151549 RepID=A0A4C1YB40_EUMVA|nr:hypothetical protein EVAR_54780_1 [Eumeta japonica]